MLEFVCAESSPNPSKLAPGQSSGGVAGPTTSPLTEREPEISAVTSKIFSIAIENVEILHNAGIVGLTASSLTECNPLIQRCL